MDLVMNSSIASIASQFKAKKLNPLMVFNEKRDPALPEIPTAVELGYDVVAAPYTGIAGPKGMDKAILEKLREVFKKVIADPEFLKGIEGVGEGLDPAVGDEFLKVWKNRLRRKSPDRQEDGPAQLKKENRIPSPYPPRGAG